MILVNLLPYHLRPIKRTPIPYIACMIAAVLIIGAIALVILSDASKISSAKGELEAHKKELDKLRDVVEENNNLVKQKQQLAKKMLTIEEIVSGRIIWSKQLYNLAKLTPENFWFSDINVSTAPFKEEKKSIDPKTKKPKVTVITVPKPVLNVSGYVAPTVSGTKLVHPLIYATQRDKEFAEVFKFLSSDFEDTDFQGFPVKEFSLVYVIGSWSNGK